MTIAATNSYSAAPPRQRAQNPAQSSLKRLCTEVLLQHPQNSKADKYYLNLLLSRDVHPEAVEGLIQKASAEHKLPALYQTLGAGKWHDLDLRKSSLTIEELSEVVKEFPSDNQISTASFCIKGQLDELFINLLAKKFPKLYRLHLFAQTSPALLEGLELGQRLTPLAELENLKDLSIHGLRFGKGTVADLAKLKLESLGLHFAYIETMSLKELQGFQQLPLRELSLSELSFAPEAENRFLEACPVKELKALKICQMQRAPDTWKLFTRADKLEQAMVANNPVSDELFLAFSKLSQLQSLDLSGTRSQDRHLQLLKDKKLRVLRLKGTEITDEGLEAIDRSQLAELDLSQTEPQELGFSKLSFPALGKLDLRDIPDFTGLFQQALRSAPLYWLSLMSCSELQWDDKFRFSALQGVKNLVLTSTDVGDKALEEIAELKLDRLWLANCPRITDQGLKVLVAKPPKYLCLTNNPQLSDEIIAELRSRCELECLS